MTRAQYHKYLYKIKFVPKRERREKIVVGLNSDCADFPCYVFSKSNGHRPSYFTVKDMCGISLNVDFYVSSIGTISYKKSRKIFLNKDVIVTVQDAVIEDMAFFKVYEGRRLSFMSANYVGQATVTFPDFRSVKGTKNVLFIGLKVIVDAENYS